MKQKYRDGLVSSIESGRMGWDDRVLRSARRIFTAVCFRESSMNLFEKSENALLSPIGCYYSLFHMSVATLSIDYCTPRTDLVKIKHSKLRNLLKDKLVKKDFLSSDFLNLLIELQEIREFVNYQFGVSISLRHRIPKLYHDIGVCFDEAIEYISCISDVHDTISEYSLWGRIVAIISDGIGNDTFDTYLSEDDSNRVSDYLLSKELMH